MGSETDDAGGRACEFDCWTVVLVGEGMVVRDAWFTVTFELEPDPEFRYPEP